MQTQRVQESRQRLHYDQNRDRQHREREENHISDNLNDNGRLLQTNFYTYTQLRIKVPVPKFFFKFPKNV